MRKVSRALARSARSASLGALALVAILATGSIASAQTAAPAAGAQAGAPVAVPPPSAQVTGTQTGSAITLNIDSPTAGIPTANGQRVFVGGWAGVPGSQDSGIRSVDIYLDGGPSTGTLLGSATLGISRPDVASVTRNAGWEKSGFNFDWTPRFVTEGTHTLSIVAHAANGATATQEVPISACGCGSSFQGSVTNPGVRRIGTIGWELDTGGPGILIQRELPPWPW
jgi:hypothetical protein